ncbi:hypothetical protein [Duncaniella dubosii]|uniref:hypothetical protein n=1 Tax=Duncaniella dubosii TaxID=2518971 RepID=UPI003F66B464
MLSSPERSGSKRGGSDLSLLDALTGYNLIEVKLETGRKHPIRVTAFVYRFVPIKGEFEIWR